MNTITKLIAAAMVALLTISSVQAASFSVANEDGLLIPYNIIGTNKVAVGNCDFSSSVTTIKIPSTVTYNQTSYVVSAISNEAFDYYYGSHALTKVILPNTIEDIGDNAFNACFELKDINLSELSRLKRIGKKAFDQCYKLTYVYLPDNLEEIGDYAFSNCKGLEYIHLGNSTQKIGKGILFGGHPNLSMVTGNFTVNHEFVIYNGELQVWAGGGKMTCTIPDGVTTIGSSVFESCNGLEEVSIPNSVVKIGSGAFMRCTGLTSVQLPNSIEEIDNCAFYGCTCLTSINIPNKLKTLELGSTFEGCSSLNCEIVIPSTLTILPDNVFNGCTKLRTVTFPSTLTENGKGCFKNTFLQFGNDYTKFPNGLKVIGEEAFAGSRVEAALFCEGLTTIGESAFADCPNLSRISFPSTICIIGDNAFKGCYNLDVVFCYALTPPALIESTSPFTGCDLANAWLFVVQGTKSAYQSATVWKDFGTFKDSWKPATAPGDVNGDGTVDIADVNCVINVILGSEDASKYSGRADVNGDGAVDIADVNAIINIILG